MMYDGQASPNCHPQLCVTCNKVLKQRVQFKQCFNKKSGNIRKMIKVPFPLDPDVVRWAISLDWWGPL